MKTCLSLIALLGLMVLFSQQVNAQCCPIGFACPISVKEVKAPVAAPAAPVVTGCAVPVIVQPAAKITYQPKAVQQFKQVAVPKLTYKEKTVLEPQMVYESRTVAETKMVLEPKITCPPAVSAAVPIVRVSPAVPIVTRTATAISPAAPIKVSPAVPLCPQPILCP